MKKGSDEALPAGSIEPTEDQIRFNCVDAENNLLDPEFVIAVAVFDDRQSLSALAANRSEA